GGQSGPQQEREQPLSPDRRRLCRSAQDRRKDEPDRAERDGRGDPSGQMHAAAALAEMLVRAVNPEDSDAADQRPDAPEHDVRRRQADRAIDGEIGQRSHRDGHTPGHRTICDMRNLCFVVALGVVFAPQPQPQRAARATVVSISGREFVVNGRPTYSGRSYDGMNVQGLLFNSRMVQGIFDDRNPETRDRWNYPDGRWDPERNTREFIAAMPLWKAKGLLAFTINLQGGSPEGYSRSQPWVNSAFESDGRLRPDYLARLERILDRADELGMVAIVGFFYQAQDRR